MSDFQATITTSAAYMYFILKSAVSSIPGPGLPAKQEGKLLKILQMSVPRPLNAHVLRVFFSSYFV